MTKYTNFKIYQINNKHVICMVYFENLLKKKIIIIINIMQVDALIMLYYLGKK